jgi:hypothetical protein
VQSVSQCGVEGRFVNFVSFFVSHVHAVALAQQ